MFNRLDKLEQQADEAIRKVEENWHDREWQPNAMEMYVKNVTSVFGTESLLSRQVIADAIGVNIPFDDLTARSPRTETTEVVIDFSTYETTPKGLAQLLSDLWDNCTLACKDDVIVAAKRLAAHFGAGITYSDVARELLDLDFPSESVYTILRSDLLKIMQAIPDREFHREGFVGGGSEAFISGGRVTLQTTISDWCKDVRWIHSVSCGPAEEPATVAMNVAKKLLKNLDTSEALYFFMGFIYDQLTWNSSDTQLKYDLGRRLFKKADEEILDGMLSEDISSEYTAERIRGILLELGHDAAPQMLQEVSESEFIEDDWELTDSSELQYVHGMLERGIACCFVGPDKSCKSLMMQELAMSVASGVPFLGQQARQGKVFFYSGESEQEVVKRRKIAFVERTDATRESITENFIQPRDFPRIESEKSIKRFIDQLARHRPSLVVFDPINFVLGDEDMNNAKVMVKVLRSIELICLYMGATPVFAFNANKTDFNATGHKELDHRAIPGGGSGAFAPSWIAVNRRKSYKHDYTHDLHVNFGSRRGLDNYRAVRIIESANSIGHAMPTKITSYTRDELADAEKAESQAKSHANKLVELRAGVIDALTEHSKKSDVIKARDAEREIFTRKQEGRQLLQSFVDAGVLTEFEEPAKRGGRSTTMYRIDVQQLRKCSATE